jgi:hypothetical protein
VAALTRCDEASCTFQIEEIQDQVELARCPAARMLIEQDAVSQADKRKDAVCAYLDLARRHSRSFLDLRKNTGDDHRRPMA